MSELPPKADIDRRLERPEMKEAANRGGLNLM